MRLSDIKKPEFDPMARVKDGRMLHVTLSPYQWQLIEVELGRHITASEISELITGIFSGKYQIVER